MSCQCKNKCQGAKARCDGASMVKYCPGPRGPAGADGRDGRDGPDGRTGKDGMNGVGPNISVTSFRPLIEVKYNDFVQEFTVNVADPLTNRSFWYDKVDNISGKIARTVVFSIDTDWTRFEEVKSSAEPFILRFPAECKYNVIVPITIVPRDSIDLTYSGRMIPNGPTQFQLNNIIDFNDPAAQFDNLILSPDYLFINGQNKAFSFYSTYTFLVAP